MSARYQAEITREAVVDTFAELYDDPALFIESILNAPPMRGWQRELCDSIASRLSRGDRRLKILVRSCHGAGKSWIAAALLLWFMATRTNSRGLTIAPTWKQTEKALWPNVAKLYQGSRIPWLREIWPGARLLSTSIEFGKDWFADGASSDNPQNLEGYHAGGDRGKATAAIRIGDEAKAISQESFDATEGLLDAEETIDLMISTPMLPSGAYYDRDLNGGPEVIRFLVDVDRLIAEGVPGKAEWKEDRARTWGVASPEFQSRCLARYVDNAEGALIPLSWVEAAERRVPTEQELADLDRVGAVAGTDVAGSVDGDETAVALVRNSDALLEGCGLQSWRDRDTMKSKARAVAIAREGSATLRIDSIGIGQGVYNAACEDGVVPVEEYRASERPMDPERFVNRKAEDSWVVRQRFEKGQVSLARIPEAIRLRLKSQIAAMRYEYTSSGKMKVVDPDDSPDLFDAFLIASARSRPGMASVDVDWL